MFRISFCIAQAMVALALLAGAPPLLAQPFQFVALGDLPYGPPAQSYGPYRRLITAINRTQPLFSVHVGDIKAGYTRCSDDEFSAQLGHFNLFEAGVVYTPGDNDWTDCHRPNNGSYDPIERLAALRKILFVNGLSLGRKPLPLQNQSTLMPAHARYVENQRWVHKDVLFVTLHIIGSNNNFEVRDPRAVAEFFERDAANVAWIKDAFELASRQSLKALVFAMQADTAESKSTIEDFPPWSGFRKSIGETLLPLAARARLPVLLIHGDGHVLRFDQPFTLERKPVREITRLEVPGAEDVRAVQVTVDTSQAMPFAIRVITPD